MQEAEKFPRSIWTPCVGRSSGLWREAPINQLVGTVGAPLVNVNVPCPAPWQQGGLLGSDYNACSTAPVYQQDAAVKGSLIGR